MTLPENEKRLQQQVSDLQAQVKALKKQKKYGLVWEEKPEQIVEDCRTKVPILRLKEKKKGVSLVVSTGETRGENILIEGDNYHALSVLKYTHKEKIDLIYIDPPYNTGARNWKYNNDYVDKEDEYRHSKWLSFMGHRLEIAKDLLSKNGVLICAIDENEHAHLVVQLERMFPAHEIHSIVILHNPKGVQGTNFSYTHEYAVFVVPQNKKVIMDRGLRDEEMYVSNLRNWGSESLRTDAKNCFYPIIIRGGKIVGFGEVAPDKFHPKSANEPKGKDVLVWPIDEKGVERKWRYARQSVEAIVDVLQVEQGKKGRIQIMIAKDYGTYKTVWADKRFDASEYGTKLLREIVPGCDFDFPKSLYAVYDCLCAVVGENKQATILDFFAGSGTTGHAVLEMNKKDEGSRSFILATNAEVGEEREKEFRLKYKIDAETLEAWKITKKKEWTEFCDSYGIAASVTYERLRRVISGYKNKKGEKVAGLGGNLRYYKTDLVDIERLHRTPDQAKVALTYQVGEMVGLREGTLDETEKNEWWQIFEGSGRQTAIYFKEDKQKLPELVEQLERAKKPAALYVFSWGKNEYRSEYASATIRVEDIPEPILEVYKEINRM